MFPGSRLCMYTSGIFESFEFPFRGIRITTVDADHGDQCPDAVGLLLGFSGRQLYFTGEGVEVRRRGTAR